jgi:photosystem II stability/assembly factor-like uncharacterized protein
VRPRLRVTAVAAVAIVAVLAPAARAQGQWIQLGPGGGYVSAIVIDPVTPSIVYVGTRYGGAFRSTDSGGTWTPIVNGLPALGVGSLVIDPQTPSTLYAGIAPYGLFRTTDSGANWSLVSDAQECFCVLAIDPQTPSVLFAASEEGGILKSVDSGATWTPMNDGLVTNRFVSAIGIDPYVPSTVFVGIAGTQNLFRSVNGGASWTQVLDLPFAPMVFAFGETSATVFVGANSPVYGGVYRTTDGGDTWTNIAGGSSVRGLVVDPQTSTTLFASDIFGGLRRSTNGGDTWTVINNGLPSSWWFGPLAINPATPSTVFVVTDGGGTFRTVDGGEGWAAVNQGLNAVVVKTLAVDPQSPSTIYAGSMGSGTFRSTDAGVTWTPINSGLADLTIESLVADPAASGTVYAATRSAGVFRTTDRGGTWTPANLGLPALDVTLLAAPPWAAGTLFASLTDDGTPRFYRSLDGATQWTPIDAAPPGGVRSLVFDPTTPGVIYALAGGVFISKNGGTDWTSVSDGLIDLSGNPGSGAALTALAIDPVTPSILYVVRQGEGQGARVYRSTNAGGTWAPLSAEITDWQIVTLVVDPLVPTTLYASTADPMFPQAGPPAGDGVLRSLDGGMTWAPFNDGLINPGVGPLVIHPQNSSWVLAGTNGSSLFRYSPATATFRKLTPSNASMQQPTSTQISWSASPGADSYEYCIDTSHNHVCNGAWISTGSNTSALPIALIAGTTYSWQVRAVTGGETTEADFGAWWQFSVGLTPGADLIRNGGFNDGLTTWLTFATPDSSYIVHNLTEGVFQFYRVAPPPGTTNQAVLFQETDTSIGAGEPLVAGFDLGNSSNVRKRISVLVLDANFSDLAVCTFWLAPNAPLQRYGMRTYTTQPWANAAIYFYAASAGADGGFLRIDNVQMQHAPIAAESRTECIDPNAPAPVGGAPSGNLLMNGGFEAGLAPWGLFGQIVHQLVVGVFEFVRSPGSPAGVVLQTTGEPVPAGTVLTAVFQLGNSSGVRKRVTVLVHAPNFSDLAACTFWLPPEVPMATYSMRTFAGTSWSGATISFYPSTAGSDQWIRLDDVSLERTPAVPVAGTECVSHR